MIARALSLLLLVGMPTGASSTEPAEDGRADACQGDVHRLCDKFFPDETLVATCLIDRRAELSPACAEVLAHPPGDDEAAGPGARPAAGAPPSKASR